MCPTSVFKVGCTTRWGSRFYVWRKIGRYKRNQIKYVFTRAELERELAGDRLAWELFEHNERIRNKKKYLHNNIQQ